MENYSSSCKRDNEKPSPLGIRLCIDSLTVPKTGQGEDNVILIIDFGSQYNQLIARRVREHRVYCQIEPPWITLDQIKALSPEGIILSGGPASIYEKNSPKVDPGIFDLGVPVLGICYGMQYMVDALGGKVRRAKKREYGHADLQVKGDSLIFEGIDKKTPCWMSHGDTIVRQPRGFKIIGSTANTKISCHGKRQKEVVRPPVSSGSGPHPQGQEDAPEFSFSRMWVQKDMDDEVFHQKLGGRHQICRRG